MTRFGAAFATMWIVSTLPPPGASTGISVFASGYFRSSDGAAPGLVGLQYHVFLAAMALVLVADDAYAFMVAWETMALASFFLVTTDHRLPCPCCGGRMIIVEVFARGAAPRGPPPSDDDIRI